MGKFFTTEGPIKPEWHYYVPMLERFHAHKALEKILPLLCLQ